jgi:hypothetical protein
MFMLLSCQAAGKRENEPSWRVYFISELGMINIKNSEGKNKGQRILTL